MKAKKCKKLSFRQRVEVMVKDLEALVHPPEPDPPDPPIILEIISSIIFDMIIGLILIYVWYVIFYYFSETRIPIGVIIFDALNQSRHRLRLFVQVPTWPKWSNLKKLSNISFWDYRNYMFYFWKRLCSVSIYVVILSLFRFYFMSRMSQVFNKF